LSFRAIDNEGYPRIHIEKVAPSDQVKEVGTVDELQTVTSLAKGEVGGTADSGVDFGLIKAQFGLGAKIAKKRNNEIITRSSYANKRYSALVSGVGTDAIWEFEQGYGAGRRGQYILMYILK
jgi:hypothetical protein